MGNHGSRIRIRGNKGCIGKLCVGGDHKHTIAAGDISTAVHNEASLIFLRPACDIIAHLKRTEYGCIRGLKRKICALKDNLGLAALTDSEKCRGGFVHDLAACLRGLQRKGIRNRGALKAEYGRSVLVRNVGGFNLVVGSRNVDDTRQILGDRYGGAVQIPNDRTVCKGFVIVTVIPAIGCLNERTEAHCLRDLHILEHSDLVCRCGCCKELIKFLANACRRAAALCVGHAVKHTGLGVKIRESKVLALCEADRSRCLACGLDNTAGDRIDTGVIVICTAEELIALDLRDLVKRHVHRRADCPVLGTKAFVSDFKSRRGVADQNTVQHKRLAVDGDLLGGRAVSKIYSRCIGCIKVFRGIIRGCTECVIRISVRCGIHGRNVNEIAVYKRTGRGAVRQSDRANTVIYEGTIVIRLIIAVRIYGNGIRIGGNKGCVIVSHSTFAVVKENAFRAALCLNEGTAKNIDPITVKAAYKRLTNHRQVLSVRACVGRAGIRRLAEIEATGGLVGSHGSSIRILLRGVTVLFAVDHLIVAVVGIERCCSIGSLDPTVRTRGIDIELICVRLDRRRAGQRQRIAVQVELIRGYHSNIIIAGGILFHALAAANKAGACLVVCIQRDLHTVIHGTEIIVQRRSVGNVGDLVTDRQRVVNLRQLTVYIGLHCVEGIVIINHGRGIERYKILTVHPLTVGSGLRCLGMILNEGLCFSLRGSIVVRRSSVCPGYSFINNCIFFHNNVIGEFESSLCRGIVCTSYVILRYTVEGAAVRVHGNGGVCIALTGIKEGRLTRGIELAVGNRNRSTARGGIAQHGIRSGKNIKLRIGNGGRSVVDSISAGDIHHAVRIGRGLMEVSAQNGNTRTVKILIHCLAKEVDIIRIIGIGRFIVIVAQINGGIIIRTEHRVLRRGSIVKRTRNRGIDIQHHATQIIKTSRRIHKRMPIQIQKNGSGVIHSGGRCTGGRCRSIRIRTRPRDTGNLIIRIQGHLSGVCTQGTDIVVRIGYTVNLVRAGGVQKLLHIGCIREIEIVRSYRDLADGNITHSRAGKHVSTALIDRIIALGNIDLYRCVHLIHAAGHDGLANHSLGHGKVRKSRAVNGERPRITGGLKERIARAVEQLGFSFCCKCLGSDRRANGNRFGRSVGINDCRFGCRLFCQGGKCKNANQEHKREHQKHEFLRVSHMFLLFYLRHSFFARMPNAV